MERIIIRNMKRDDLRQVHALERQCFTTPWQFMSFEHELSNKDAIIRVAVSGDQVIGYVCFRSILDATHVLDLAVDPKFRRLGIGSMLVGKAVQDLRRLRPETRQLTLEVRESNIAAITLYEKFGFREIGRRHGYYQRPSEDAVIMERDLDSDDSPSLLH